jgi:hypothetical protein
MKMLSTLIKKKNIYCRSETYNIFKHNCNNFSNEISLFLVGKGIPKYILDLTETLLQS